MVASAAESVGRIHALFNNAGVQARPRGPPRQERGPYTDSLHAAKVPHARRTAAAQPRGTLVQLQTGQALELFGSRASRP